MDILNLFTMSFFTIFFLNKLFQILDPNTNTCFGDSFSKFILENLLGYEDVLMSSVKSLADKENNKVSFIQLMNSIFD